MKPFRISDFGFRIPGFSPGSLLLCWLSFPRLLCCLCVRLFRSRLSAFGFPIGLRLVGLLWVLTAVPAFGGANLLPNGDFDKGGDKWPANWHCKLTDYMPKEQENAEGVKSYRYICACGHDLGEVKPWCGLICPKCGGFLSGEECGAWYVQNHERVSLIPDGNGYCVKFTLDKSTGENQGVRIMSDLIKVKPAWGYILTFRCKTKGAIARVFAECYRKPKGWKSANWEGPHDKAIGKDERIERIYRGHVNCGSPGTWTAFTKELVAPEKYQFEYISVKPYAYMPGEAWFDDFSIRPMTTAEYEKYMSERKPKDKRFKY